MKAIRLIIILFLIGLSTSVLSAQSINMVTWLPQTPLECTNTIVTVTGDLFCANASIQSTSHQIIGNTILIFVDVLQPPICLPAIIPYTTDIHLGLVPAGAYTLQVMTLLNGATNSTVNAAITIASCDPCTMTKSCCDSITLNEPTILTGVYEAAISLSASGNVPPNQSVSFTSGMEILLSAGFGVDSSSNFSAEIGPCSGQPLNVPLKHELVRFRNE